MILFEGAIGSHHILLLSGIEPSTEVSALGIPVSHNSSHTGNFLYDNPRNSISFMPSIPAEGKQTLTYSISLNFNIPVSL